MSGGSTLHGQRNYRHCLGVGGAFSYASSGSNPPSDLTVDTLAVSADRVSAGGWSRKLAVNTLFEINGTGEKVFALPSADLVNNSQAKWGGPGIIELSGTFHNEGGTTEVWSGTLKLAAETGIHSAGVHEAVVPHRTPTR